MAAESSSGSDRDDALDEDMEALRRACVIAGADRAELGPDSDDDSSSGTDDLDLLRSIQERFPFVVASLSVAKPLSSRKQTEPCADEDEEEDDFETLRAIQRRFSQHESGPETPNALSENRRCQASGKLNLDSVYNELHQEEDETCDVSLKPFTFHQFPKSAQNFVDALKKNRSCQKFIRRKLIEIEARIEENKELKERVKCLMDFQIACKRKVGHVFSQKKDPRIRLISTQKTRIPKTQKDPLYYLDGFLMNVLA